MRAGKLGVPENAKRVFVVPNNDRVAAAATAAAEAAIAITVYQSLCMYASVSPGRFKAKYKQGIEIGLFHWLDGKRHREAERKESERERGRQRARRTGRKRPGTNRE